MVEIENNYGGGWEQFTMKIERYGGGWEQFMVVAENDAGSKRCAVGLHAWLGFNHINIMGSNGSLECELPSENESTVPSYNSSVPVS
jgi:hypothetical protein